MSCRNLFDKLYELKRCGCRSCEEEYYHLRNRDYRRERDYYREPPQQYLAGPILATIPAATPKEPKMEEPKNIAIKLLVDKLKSEQSGLAYAEAMLKTYEGHVKTYRDAKNKNLRQIRDLAAALKKLGHKDA